MTQQGQAARQTPTPGPWVVEGNAENGFVIGAGDGGGHSACSIASIHGTNVGHREEAAANAHLIAAAPELLAALKALIRVTRTSIASAEQAIASAEGRG